MIESDVDDLLSQHRGEFVAHWKGAAEMILELSDQWVDTNGSLQTMTQDNVSTHQTIAS